MNIRTLNETMTKSNPNRGYVSGPSTNTVHSGGSRISPRRGRQLPGGRQHMILPKFPKNCMKSKEFGPPRGAHVPCAPP